MREKNAHSITLGTAKKPCSACGALASTASRMPPSVTHVVAQAQMVGDHRGERLDAGRVDLAKLLDPADDVVEFGQQRLGLGIAGGDAREAGDLADGGEVDGHKRPASTRPAMLQAARALALVPPLLARNIRRP